MTLELEFTKMHGAGNDFVVLDGIAQELPPLEPLARRLADRHFGVGFDQMLVVRRSKAADFRMEIYNADGSQAEMCANGIRAFYKFLRDRGHTDADSIRVETLGGVVVPRWAGEDRVTVEMGMPVLAPAKIPTLLGEGDGPVLDARLEVGGENPPGQLRLDGKPPRRDLRGRHRRRPGRGAGASGRESSGLPEPRQRGVRRAGEPRSGPSAHLGAGHRRDPRLRKRSLRGGRRLDSSRCGGPQRHWWLFPAGNCRYNGTATARASS